MEYYTIVIDHNSMVVVDGIRPKSQIAYHAPDIIWYTSNTCGCKLSETRKDTLAHVVLTHAISMHIPAMSVKKFVKPVK